MADPITPNDDDSDESPDPAAPPAAAAPPSNDSAAMADALRRANAEAKRYRLEAKAQSEKLEQLAQQTMTDVEKAVAHARAEGLREGQRSGGSRLVDAEVRAAAAGRNVDVVALLEGLDRTRFLDDDGEPDVQAIQKWVDRIVPPVTDDDAETVPRVRMGPRSQSGNPQALNGDPLLRDLKRKLGIS